MSDVEIRRNEIIELLYTYKKYSIDDFAKRFGVSRRTIPKTHRPNIKKQVEKRKKRRPSSCLSCSKMTPLPWRAIPNL